MSFGGGPQGSTPFGLGPIPTAGVINFIGTVVIVSTITATVTMVADARPDVELLEIKVRVTEPLCITIEDELLTIYWDEGMTWL